MKKTKAQNKSAIDSLLEYLGDEDKRSPLDQALIDAQDDFRAMLNSKGYAVWSKWAEAHEAKLWNDAALGETKELREEAHHQLTAFRHIRMLPLMMADKIREINTAEDNED